MSSLNESVPDRRLAGPEPADGTPGAQARWWQLLVDRIAGVAGVIAGVALIAMTVAVTYSVIARLLNVNATWPFPLESFASAWFAMAGAAYTAVKGGHVMAGISIARVLPQRGKGIVMEIQRVTVCAYLLLVLWTGAQATQDAIESHEVTNDLLQWPIWIVRLAIPVGAAAWLLVMVTLPHRRLREV